MRQLVLELYGKAYKKSWEAEYKELRISQIFLHLLLNEDIRYLGVSDYYEDYIDATAKDFYYVSNEDCLHAILFAFNLGKQDD